jgi:restriction system protein
VLSNRVSWARTYLTKAGLLTSPRRGFHQITERGHEALAANPPKIDVTFLSRYPEFSAFRSARRERLADSTGLEPATDSVTPQEALEAAYQRIRADLEAELLDRLLI